MNDWPHAPLHRFGDEEAVYFVTGATYLKKHHYRSTERIERLQARFFRLAEEYECHLQAWSIFSNHYHLVAGVRGTALHGMLTDLHREEGLACNAEDGARDRQGGYQVRERVLRFERSWLGRLGYTREKAVDPRLVSGGSRYRWG